MIRLNQIKVKIEDDVTKLIETISRELRVNKQEIREYRIVKRSIDARDNQQIYFVYTLDVTVNNEQKLIKRNKRLEISPTSHYELPHYGDAELKQRPIIVGFGPSGMFAALILAEMGLKPIVFERGSEVEQRIEDVEDFWKNRRLNIHSNMQFGEGGAGTFSDGKLTTRVKDIRGQKILKEFVEAGAPEEIMAIHNPHIGTDILVTVVKNIREKIKSLGGDIYFNHVVDDVQIVNNKINAITVNDKVYKAQDVILAIGHSARDTFEMLYEKGLTMRQKAFAVGLRIEHPQALINRAQFGEKYQQHPKLGAAEYKLTYKASNDKSVYTFCMCPGGTVVMCSSELETVVVNGMSEYKRDQENANSALVCTVNEHDFGSAHPLAGLQFQRELEKRAFHLGGGNYHAPVQLVKDFLLDKASESLKEVKPSISIGYKLTNLTGLFPNNITLALKEAITNMNNQLSGFSIDEAILTGVETRTSSPLRIEREKLSFQSVNVGGLYPTGEGAGYAGGIMSAAIDGVKVAEKIVNKYMPRN